MLVSICTVVPTDLHLSKTHFGEHFREAQVLQLLPELGRWTTFGLEPLREGSHFVQRFICVRGNLKGNL